MCTLVAEYSICLPTFVKMLKEKGTSRSGCSTIGKWKSSSAEIHRRKNVFFAFLLFVWFSWLGMYLCLFFGSGFIFLYKYMFVIIISICVFAVLCFVTYLLCVSDWFPIWGCLYVMCPLFFFCVFPFLGFGFLSWCVCMYVCGFLLVEICCCL